MISDDDLKRWRYLATVRSTDPMCNMASCWVEMEKALPRLIGELLELRTALREALDLVLSCYEPEGIDDVGVYDRVAELGRLIDLGNTSTDGAKCSST